MKIGVYTIEGSVFYWRFIPKYKNDTYVKCKLTLMYKKGRMKGVPVEQKNYKLYLKNIQHWKPYAAY